MSDIKIDFNIENHIKEVSNYIDDLANNLKRLYDISVIDKEYWNTKEHDIYIDIYLNYIKELNLNYPLYLKNYLEILKNAVLKYKELDQKQNRNI